MTTNTATGYQGGKKRRTPRNPTTEHEGRVSQPGVPSGPRNSNGAPPKKAVVTIHSDGRVTAKGPGAKAGKKEAEAGVERVEREVAATTKYELEHGGGEDAGRRVKPKSTSGLGVNLADIGKTLLRAAGAQDPTAKSVRSFAKDEAASILEAEEEHQRQEIGGGPAHYKGPSANQVNAALTEASLIPVTDAGAGVKALSKAASAASDTETASKAAGKVVAKVKSAPKDVGRAVRDYPGRKVRAVKAAPRRAADSVRSAPEKIRSAPRAAKDAATTPQGRKAAGKYLKGKAYSHPVISAGALGSATNNAGVEVPGLKQAGALVEGTVKGFLNDPKKTLETTARAVPAAITGPAALVESAGVGLVHGTPKPLEEELVKQGKGLYEIGGKLFSGNEAEVQKAVEDEVGLAFTPLIPSIGRAKELKVYKDAKGKVRAVVSDAREGTRADRRQQIEDFKTGDRSKKPRSIRQPVYDTTTGQERVFRRTGKLIEGHKQRKAVSRSLSREKARGEREAHLASKEVIKEIRKSKHTGGVLVKRNLKEHNAGDILATVAQYGISRDRTKAMRQLHDIQASIGKHHPDEIPYDTITDLSNIEWIRRHPKIFDDTHFWKAVDAYKKQAKAIERSGRKKVLAVGDVYGLARPEERLEAGVDVGGRKVATHFYKDPDSLARKQAELHDLRSDAKQLAMESAQHTDPAELAKYNHLAQVIHGKAKTLERELKDYRRGFSKAQKDYVREAQATIREKGLEQPAYVKDVKPRQGLTAEPNFPGGRSARKQHMAGGSARERGVTARDFETLVNQSIAEPRMRAAMHRATTNFVEEWAHSVKGKRYMTSKEIDRAINRGDLDPSQYAVLDSQFFKQAVLDPHKGGDEFADAVRQQSSRPIAQEIRGRANDTGKKYVVVPKEAVREFVHQMEPPKGLDKLFGGANRLLTRFMLGYSPAWAVAQLVAEGIPAAAGVGLNPARWARVVHYLAGQDRKLTPEDRSAIDAMVGESAGVTPHPQTQFRPDTNTQASTFFRLAERNPVGRTLLSAGKGDVLGGFDRYKGGKYRKAVAAAKADRELNGFVTNLGELMRGQRSIVEAIKGKPLDEQMNYIASHPKEAAKLETYLDNLMGNWRSLSRHEAKFAPLVIFYPFVRYALRWTFWAFPKEHPIKAQILYFLAQQNSQELEKINGGPVDFLKNALPVYTTSQGDDAVVPGGSRISPGLTFLTESIGTGNIAKLGSGLNPAIGIVNAGINGVDSYSGEVVAHSPIEHALLAANELLSTFTPFRAAGLDELGHGEQSASSKRYEELDPEHDNRSFGMPFIPQSGREFRETEHHATNQREKYENPVPSLPPELFEIAANHDWKAMEQVVKQRKRSEAAGDRVTAEQEKFYEDQGFDKEASEILAYGTGYYQIPAEIKPPKKKVKVKGIGGGGSGIGGRPLGGGIGGGSGGGIGGGTGGGIGGRPLGGRR